MPIYRLLEGGAFDPEALTAMTTAFEDALRELKLMDRADPLAETVARKIVEIAQLGERDPVRLRDIALKSLKDSAYWR